MTEKTPVEERFRYIGFEVFPKEAKPLFESPEEEKKYLEKIRRRKFKIFFLEREHSLIEVPAITAFDKTIVLLSSLLVLLGVFVFPVGSLYVKGIGNLSVTGLQFLLSLGNLSYYLALAPIQLTILAGLAAAFLVLGAILGMLQLVILVVSWKSAQGRRVSLMNRLGLVPVILWMAALVLTLFSVPTPVWGLLGIEQLGETFHIARLVSISGWGLWAVFIGLIINRSIVAE